ncbi:MAG: hypothetical protein V1774_10770 [Candidatus Eisenbacteria bacterium]
MTTRREGKITLRLLAGTLAAAGGFVAGAIAQDASVSDSVRCALVEESRAAIEIGDEARANRLLDELALRDPGTLVLPYLRGRLLESEGRWGEALVVYSLTLVERAPELSREWMRLLSGRWAWAGWNRDEARLRESADHALDEQPGRCIVFPLEPLILDEGGRGQREQLDALGTAAAAWIIATLAPRADGEVLSLHSAFRLLRRATPQAQDAGSFVGEEPMPPVTTQQGVARRLAAMTPQAPPPWGAQAAVPRYLTIDAAASPGQIERALAHFQVEHDLVPTGILNPETQVALERAYREARLRQASAGPVFGGNDPLRAAANRLGASALLTGTIERLDSGDLRWNAVWVAAADGALLSEPAAGLLPATRFAQAWEIMTGRIAALSPNCVDSALCASSVVGAPSREGALAFGHGVHFLENGQTREAAITFRRSADSGGGPLAEWSAMAWGLAQTEMQRLEAVLIEDAMFGRPQVPADLLRAEGDVLARGVQSCSRGRFLGQGDWLAGQTLRSLPYGGWIEVVGSVEDP